MQQAAALEADLRQESDWLDWFGTFDFGLAYPHVHTFVSHFGVMECCAGGSTAAWSLSDGPVVLQ